MRGIVLHCSRFGAVVRLEDGRLGMLPSDGAGSALIRRAVLGGRRPQFPFVLEEERGRHVRLSVADAVVRENDDRPLARSSSSLEHKIIDYLRQTAEWDSRITAGENTRNDERPRADRLLPFEYRARRQYRETPERPRRRKR